MLKRLLGAAFGLLLVTDVLAADFYVKPTGSDGDTGADLAHAFATIPKGVDSITGPGDTVWVDDGTYTTGFSLLLAQSGSAEATKNITAITRANPAVVTSAGHGFSDGDIVAIHGLNSYLTNGMEQLNNQWFKVANSTADTFSLTDLDGTAIDSSAYDTYVTGGTVQRVTPVAVRAINPGNVTIDTSNTITGWSNTGLPANTYISSASTGSSSYLWKVGRTTLLIQKSSAASVTSENSYYFNSTTKQFTIYTTSNPNSSTYKQTGAAEIRVQGASWTLVEGITAQYGSVPVQYGYSSGFPTPAGQGLLGPTSHNLMRRCTAQYGVQWAGAIQTADTNKSSYNTFEKCTFAYADEPAGGQNGHCFKCAANHNEDDGTYTTFVDTTVHDCRYHGFQSSNGWSNNFFIRVRGYNSSLGSSGAAADIRCGYSGDVTKPMACQIIDSDFGGGSGGTGTGQSSGLFLQDTNVNSVSLRSKYHDHVWDGMYIFYAGTGPTAPAGFKSINDLFYNNGNGGAFIDGASSVSFYNPTMYKNGETPLYGRGAGLTINSPYASGVTLKNAIIQNPTAPTISTTNSYQLTSDYNDLYTASGFNVYWNNTHYTTLAAYQAATLAISGFEQDTHSVTGDPLFGAPASNDFRIPSPDTPADATGTDLSSIVTTDYTVAARQSPWDMGAYNTNGNLIIQPSVSPASLFPSRVTTVAVSFRLTQVDLLKNDKIEVTFPAGFVINSGGTTAATSLSNFDGTTTVSVASQVVTVARNNDGTDKSPTTFGLSLTFIQNPGTSGQTGKFSIRVLDASDVQKAANANVSAVIISDVAPGTISGGVMQGGTLS